MFYKSFRRTALALMLACCPMGAQAVPITLLHDVQGADGSLDGIPFVGRDIRITALADTDDMVLFGTGRSLPHQSVTLSISGVGHYSFTSTTRSFVNNALRLVGFARQNGPTMGADLLDGPAGNAVFATWDLASALGPIGGTMGFLNWSSNPNMAQIQTSGGILDFTYGQKAGGFQAMMGHPPAPVPVPASVALLFAAVGSLGAVSRRNRLAAARQWVHTTTTSAPAHAVFIDD